MPPAYRRAVVVRRSGAGQPDREQGAPRVRTVGRRDGAAVALGDPARDRETEARATRRRVRRAPEPVEDVLERGGIQAGSLVRDGEPCPGSRGDRDPAARRRVADGVVDEDGDELTEPGIVAVDGRRRDVEDDIVVRGSRVSSDKIRQAGFQFKFNDVQKAVADLLK